MQVKIIEDTRRHRIAKAIHFGSGGRV